jgi:hypothetical protein
MAHPSRGGAAKLEVSPISTSRDGTMSVQIRLTADKGGEWLADDIYIDPRMY